MKHKNGKTVSIGDIVKHRELGVLGTVEDVNKLTGLMMVRWYMYHPYFGEMLRDTLVRPRSVRIPEPEELI